jgi:hypothetical protein
LATLVAERIAMSKPRAQTLQQRFGFQDHDLKTPLHDEIMIWLDKNAPSILEELGWLELMVKCNRSRKNIDYAKEMGCPANLLETALNSKPSKFDITWEYPIKSKNYIIGFVDLLVTYDRAIEYV